MAPRLATTRESEGEKYGSFSIEQNTNDETPLKIEMDEAIERLGMGKFQNDILLAAGLCFSADAMEVLLLSFLSVVLKDEWDLTEREENTIISVVFAGAMVGTLILSPLGDIIGRRPVFTFTAAAISFFGIATAFCPTYEWLLFSRFMVGFGVGGLTVPVRANVFLVVVAVSRVFSCILVFFFLYSLIH
jgi:MFS family permease